MTIWTVYSQLSGVPTYFARYPKAIEYVNKAYRLKSKVDNLFPTEEQVTSKTRLGYATLSGDWVTIEAIQVIT